MLTALSDAALWKWLQHLAPASCGLHYANHSRNGSNDYKWISARIWEGKCILDKLFKMANESIHVNGRKLKIPVQFYILNSYFLFIAQVILVFFYQIYPYCCKIILRCVIKV